MTTDTTTLLACPFCGGEPTCRDTFIYSTVRCQSCEFSITRKAETGTYAPDVWNRRAIASNATEPTEQSELPPLPNGLGTSRGIVYDADQMRDYARQAIASLAQPTGEPTPEMIEAGSAVMFGHGANARGVFRAMMARAPKASTGDAAGEPVGHIVDTSKYGIFGELTEAGAELPEGTPLYAAPKAAQPETVMDKLLASGDPDNDPLMQPGYVQVPVDGNGEPIITDEMSSAFFDVVPYVSDSNERKAGLRAAIAAAPKVNEQATAAIEGKV